MRGLIPFSAILVVFAFLPMAVPAQPTVTIYTDADTYHLGDTIEVSLSADNPGAGVSVDAYIGLLAPDGAIYTLGPAGWSGNIEAWIPNIYVPSGFSFGPAALWSFDVPCSMPPIGADGDYNFAALLTRPGTFEWLSGLSLAPFTVSAASLEYYVSANLGSDGNDGSEARPWRTITHALASVTGTPGSPVTIHVLPGRYAPSTNGETFPLVMKSWVSLLGEDRDTTILDGENAAYHVILCDGVANLTIEGLTITGGKANGPEEADKSGGGIFCYGSLPTIINNTIVGNSADLFGGGIYCMLNSCPTIASNTISGNSAFVGGGISCFDSSAAVTANTINGNSADRGGGISCFGSSPAITSNRITVNSAAWGGGIYCYANSSPMIDSNTISGNGADGGGGIYCYANSSPTITNNTITDNSANLDGAGIACFWGSSPTITNNTITGNTSNNRGGGIACFWGSSPTIAANTIAGNSANVDGGGIRCDDSSPTITGNTIADNSAYTGGGISCEDSSPTITNNTITGNSTFSDGGGGGIRCYFDSSPRITGNTITGNSAGFGGGIDCYRSSPTIENNSITYNSAEASGGGIACGDSSSPAITGNTVSANSAKACGGGISSSWHSSPRIDNNTISGNSADRGGGIDCDVSSPTITGNVITDNSANVDGGGIRSYYESSPTITDNTISGNSAAFGGGVACSCDSSPTIHNNTITGNSASVDGGGIYCYENSSPTIENCTIANNYGDGGVFRDPFSLRFPTIIDSIVWGNGDDLVNCSATYCCIEDDDGGEGIIHDDPMFVSGPLGNFYLHPLSPCIDAGSRTAEEAGLSNRTTQADGTPDTGIVDMGYHYPLP